MSAFFALCTSVPISDGNAVSPVRKYAKPALAVHGQRSGGDVAMGHIMLNKSDKSRPVGAEPDDWIQPSS
ncbi:hypothetical protein [Streptomyces sp. NPDC018036]|uniref:hypothetical protein n=1 Tax=Streptomyces sp. NPDC018036 TaxID=3365035 RepID=UPI0037AAA197